MAADSAASAATAAMNQKVYDALLSTRQMKMKLDIVDTLFLDEYGDPAAWYYTDAKSRTVKAKRGDALTWDAAVDWLRSSAAAQHGAAPGAPTVVERSRAVALLLQDEDMAALAQRLSESEVQENPPTETSPFCLQPYVPPSQGVRYIAVYMRSDHGSACEAFPATYGSRYLDVTVEHAGSPGAQPPLPPVADAVLLEIRHLMLSAVTFMRKAHKMALDGLALEFVQDAEGKLLFHTVVGTQVSDKEPSWTCSYDAESKLVKSLVDRLCAKQPALKMYQRSSVLPAMGSGPMPSPQQRVKYRQQAQREIDQLLTPQPPSTPSTSPTQDKPRSPKTHRASPSSRSSQSSRTSRKGKGMSLGDTAGSEAYQTALMDTQQEWVFDAARATTPGRLHTLASLRHYQVETLKDALQEQFASATQSELERLQEANRRQQATRELETMHESYGELQRYHDAEMQKASGMIADMAQQLEEESNARAHAESELHRASQERDFAVAELEAERTAHDEKTLGHGGRIKELEQELEGLRSTLGAQVDQLSAENDELRQRMEEEREEIGALNQQLVKFSTYIEQLEGTRDEQLELITALRDEKADLLRMTPADRSAIPKEKGRRSTIKLNITDLLCREINPVAEMDLVQKALTGRKLILQELYKYYSWSPEADSASRHQKLTMSAENFVKLVRHTPPSILACPPRLCRGVLFRHGPERRTPSPHPDAPVAHVCLRRGDQTRRGIADDGFACLTVHGREAALEPGRLHSRVGGECLRRRLPQPILKAPHRRPRERQGNPRGAHPNPAFSLPCCDRVLRRLLRRRSAS